MSIFSDDDLGRLRSIYPGQPGKLTHRLTDHPLLTLEALVELGRTLPAADVEYNAGDLPIGVDPATVSSTGLSVEDTIRSIEECGSWMVLKRVEQAPAYAALLKEVLAGVAPVVERATGEMLTHQGFIFISSPGAVTPFHMDPEHNILLQIRGRKTMRVFPGDSDVVPDQMHEAYHTGGHRNLDWRDEFEALGEPFALAPGEAVHVPVKRPHWVKNGPEPSISFSITWRSHWSYEEADARGMNHLLRKWGLNPSSPAPFPKRSLGKAYAYRALRKARLLPKGA